MSREAFEKAKTKGKGPSARVEAQEEHTLVNSNKPIRVSASQIMMDAIDLRLKEYPNGASVEEEEAKLYGSRKSEVSGDNERRALVVRLGEKRVLLDQKRVLKYVLDRIHEAEAEKAKPRMRRTLARGRATRMASRVMIAEARRNNVVET